MALTCPCFVILRDWDNLLEFIGNNQFKDNLPTAWRGVSISACEGQSGALYVDVFLRQIRSGLPAAAGLSWHTGRGQPIFWLCEKAGPQCCYGTLAVEPSTSLGLAVSQ